MAEARQTEIDGIPAGAVFVEDKQVLCIRAPDGDMTALDRAGIIAGRVNHLLKEGVIPEQITFGTVDGETALLYGDFVIATVDRPTAALEGKSLVALAEEWRAELVSALLGLIGVVPAADDDEEDETEGPADALAPPAVTERVAPNGVQLLIAPLPGAKLCAVEIAVRSGSAHDGDAMGYGLAHAVSRAVLLGTRRRTQEQIDAAVLQLGGNFSTETALDRVTYRAVVPKAKLREAVDLLSDLVQNATFPHTEVAKALGQNPADEVGRDDATRTEEHLVAVMFRRSPARLRPAGHAELRRLLTRDRLLDYYDRHYVADNTTCTVAGDVVPDLELVYLQKAFAGWPYRPAPAAVVPGEPPQRGARTRTVSDFVTQEAGAVGWRTVPVWHEDVAALRLLAAILDGGADQRLRKALAEAGVRVAALQVESRTPGLDAGRFFIRWSAPAALHQTVETVVRHEAQRLREEPASEQELRAAVTRLCEELRGAAVEPAALADLLTRGAVEAGNALIDWYFLRRAAEATSASLQAVARRYLAPENSTAVSIRARR